MFLLLFILPIYLSKNGINLNSSANQETYTRNALEQAQGQVAGVATSRLNTTTALADSERYLNIPILNFRLDKSLSEPASISFMFGVIFLILGFGVGGILTWDYLRHKRY